MSTKFYSNITNMSNILMRLFSYHRKENNKCNLIKIHSGKLVRISIRKLWLYVCFFGHIYQSYPIQYHNQAMDLSGWCLEALASYLLIAHLAGRLLFLPASVCLSACLCVCVSVTNISQELVDIFQFSFTGDDPYTRGRTDLILVEIRFKMAD